MATVKSSKAEVLSISPLSEQIIFNPVDNTKLQWSTSSSFHAELGNERKVSILALGDYFVKHDRYFQGNALTIIQH